LYYLIRFKLYVVNLKNINFLNLKFIYKFGLKTFFNSFSNFANNQLGIIILSFYLSNEKIGIYSVAFGLISRFQFIPDTLNRIFVPFSNDNTQGNNDSLKLFSSFLFYLFLIILIFLLIFSNQIIFILFGSDYAEAGLLLKIISIGFVFKMLAKPIEAYYNEVMGKPGIISMINGSSLILLSILMLIMTKSYGLIGASIASSITMTLAFAVLFISFLIKEHENASGFFDLKKLMYYFKIMLKRGK
jgi:O-antigen/teichoic acid export membrane protein